MEKFAVGIVFILLFVKLLKKFIWFFRKAFLFLDRIQWILYNPLRFFFKGSQQRVESGVPRGVFTTLSFALIVPIYWVTMHILLTPLRVISSLYFDVFLYLYIMLDDSISDVYNPKLDGLRYKKGVSYIFKWVSGFPWRLLKFIAKNFTVICDSFLMVGISFVFPTLTMYHGTSYYKSATKIAQGGKWFVGNGDYAGSGIYFGIEKRVADIYTPSGPDSGTIIVRVTTSFTRNQATLPKKYRSLVGKDGERLSKNIGFFFHTIEHWRPDTNGWEYCIVQPNKSNQYVNSWRIRPVALLKNNELCRLWGGFRNYSMSFQNIFAGCVSWLILFTIIG